MKKHKAIVLILLFVFVSCKQNRENNYQDSSRVTIEQYDSLTVENLAILCKVWGFLKYYHPEVADGNYDWDSELFKVIPSVIKAESVANRNKVLYKWAKSFGNINESKHPVVIDSANIKMYPDLDWTKDRTAFSEDMIALLSKIKNAARKDSCYYVGLVQEIGNPIFQNEKGYENMSYPDVGYRLLALFRYWNIIQYYFPYRYLIDDNWHDVLPEFIPQFIEANDELGYKLTLLKLIAIVSDTHANIWGDLTLDKYKGLRSAPYEITFIEGEALVTDYYKPININCNIQKEMASCR